MFKKVLKTLPRHAPRMWDWILASVVFLGLVGWFAPQQLPLVVYKVCLVAVAANVAYWVDHSLFKRVRDRVDGDERDLFAAACIIRRALIFVGCVLGLSLGL